MTDGKKTIDDLIREIVYNKDIHALMENPFREILQFQDNECRGMILNQAKIGRTSLKREGFQVGEPFDGDIEHAPVLFLSSNPAFNVDEVSPRYHSDTEKIVMPKHKDVITKKQVSEKEMSFDEVKDFFQNRIIKSPSTQNSDQSLRISLKNGNIIAVSYWSCVRTNTELLLPSMLTSQWTSMTPSQRAREIMKYAVCMEIVPFRSKSEFGVNEKLLNTCWTDFTQHLLELSGAEVFVLVGKKAFEVFIKKLDIADEIRDELKRHQIVNMKIGDKQRIIVKVDVDMGKISRLDNKNLFSDSVVLSTLRKAVALSPLIQKATQNSTNA